MSPRKQRIAIPTKGRDGLKDGVSEVFGRSNTFTIVDVKEGVIKAVKTLENPAVSYKHGAGPIVVKMLVDSDVNLVMAPEFGPGTSTLLEQHNIEKIHVETGTIVSDAITKALSQQKPN